MFNTIDDILSLINYFNNKDFNYNMTINKNKFTLYYSNNCFCIMHDYNYIFFLSLHGKISNNIFFVVPSFDVNIVNPQQYDSLCNDGQYTQYLMNNVSEDEIEFYSTLSCPEYVSTIITDTLKYKHYLDKILYLMYNSEYEHEIITIIEKFYDEIQNS